MTLPEGFRWDKRWQYSDCHDGLFLDGQLVAMLLDKVGGGWFARLDVQRPGLDEPMAFRHCTSYETGKAGVGIWAARHEARLRSEVAEVIANRPVHLGAGHFGLRGQK